MRLKKYFPKDTSETFETRITYFPQVRKRPMIGKTTEIYCI